MGGDSDHSPERHALVALREELRSRLAAYRLTAAAHNLTEDTELATLFANADRLLTAAPSDDLVDADRAVITYMRALWHRLGHPPDETHRPAGSGKG